MTNTSKQRGRRSRLPLLCLALLFFLGGCISPEELMMAPGAAPQYEKLQNLIDLLLSEGLAYSAPATGDYRSPVEFKDLDSDGEEEAVVFLRGTSDGATDAQMAVFVPSEGGFEPPVRIIENADSVRSIAFHDFNGDGKLEITVGWSLANHHSISVYSLTDDPANEGINEILSEPYSEFVVYDEEDGEAPSLFLIEMTALPSAADASTTEFIGVAELFASRDGEMRSLASAELSRGAEAVKRVRTTPLSDGKPGFLVASQYKVFNDLTGEVNGEITDVFTYRDGILVNISRDMETGISTALIREIEIPADDIDEDGVLDLPQPILLNPYPGAEEVFPVYEILWRSYDSNGASAQTARTYYNRTRGWFLLLPEQWPDAGRYTVRRITVSENPVHTMTTFSLLDEDGGATEFLTVYYFIRQTGENPRISGRTVLVDESLLLVTADLTPLKGFSISEERLKNMFRRIPIEWGAGFDGA
ncbi:MAG: VCBS repeat-containing protein [Oscillospiraceae bacterium]|nr:VCBS repeat-containing protein [Oscillospiraceae bacterium]